MPVSNSLEEQWKASRHGAWAGRGFRFQDSAACWIALLVWSGDQPGSEIVPEGLDDLTIEGGTSWTHVQVKSRGDHRGGFPITQVVKWLKEGWRKQEARISAQKRGRMVLVLERHMEGLPSTGWGKPASEVPELKTILGKQFTGSLLDRTHIVQVPDPTSRSLRLIADRLKLPQAAGWLHVLHLKRKIGETSDANASASHTARQSVGKSAIQTLLETCTATADRDSLEEALRLDLCESVEFEGKIRFFRGIYG